MPTSSSLGNIHAKTTTSSRARKNTTTPVSPTTDLRLNRLSLGSPLKRRQSFPSIKTQLEGERTLKQGNQTRRRNCQPRGSLQERISVCVRKRPLTRREEQKGLEDILQLSPNSVVLSEPRMHVDLTPYTVNHLFYFDQVFGEEVENQLVYVQTAQPLLRHVLSGGHGICFAYGQTGSGKTHTLFAVASGLYILSGVELLGALETLPDLKLCVSFYEIYQGTLYDLLNRREKLHAREDNRSKVFVSGLVEMECPTVGIFEKTIQNGLDQRKIGYTTANRTSSRSHGILHLDLKNKDTGRLFGRLAFIDLAGCERGADRDEKDAKSRSEGAEINKSLLALKECIRALDQGLPHLPFRQSKLTQVLKESFMGEARTCIIGTVSPSSTDSENTLNTLRYIDRIKQYSGATPSSSPQKAEEPSQAAPNKDSACYAADPRVSPYNTPSTIIKQPSLVASILSTQTRIQSVLECLSGEIKRCHDEDLLELLFEELTELKDSFLLVSH